MPKRTFWQCLVIAAALFAAVGVWGQTGNGKGKSGGCVATVSTLSLTCGTVKGATGSVSDGLTGTDCTSGGGTTVAFCQYSGSVWAAITGGGSSFGPVSGTALQITVANGSTAPVISIPNPAAIGVLTVAGGTLTTDVQTLKTTQTYNNGAQAFNGLLNVTVDTAHAAGSMLRQDLCGVAGTTVCQSLDPSGNTINLGSSTASSQNAVGTGAGVLQVTQGPANSASANSAGFMAPTSIPTAYVILMPTAAATCPGVFTLGTVSAGVSQGGFSCAPVLGIDNSVAGSIQLASLAAAAHTTIASVATTSNTVNFPPTTPTSGDLLSASVPTSNVLTIADSGVLAANVVLAVSPGAGIAHFAGSAQTVTSSAIVSADITSLAESKLTGSTAATTITEPGTGNSLTRAGVETGNLTAGYVIGNTNSSNNNTSVGLIVGAAGTSTGGIGELVFDVSGTGDIQRWYTGGSIASGVYTVGTLEANLTAAGAFNTAGGTVPTVGTSGGFFAIEGTAPTGTSTNYGLYNDSTLHCPDLLAQSVNLGCAVGETAIIAANTITKALGTTSKIAASSITDNGSTTAFAEAARGAGVVPYFQITIPADTAQTAATESPGFQTVTGTRTWATTGTVALQRENFFAGPTYASAGASQTFTDAFTLYSTPPIPGTNAIFTRGHTLGIVDSTSAASAITGGVVVATTLGTAATSVGIGGGNVNAGGTVTAQGMTTTTLAATSTTALGSSGQFAVSAAGLVTKSNNITLAGQGLTGIVGITSQKSETTTADANVLTVTPASAVGTYRACVVVSVSAATSGVISWTLSWHDSNAATQANIAQSLFQQATGTPATTFTTSAAGNYNSCSMIDVDNSGSSIIVKWVGGGTTTAKMSATVERII